MYTLKLEQSEIRLNGLRTFCTFSWKKRKEKSIRLFAPKNFNENLDFVLVIFFWQVVQPERNDEAGVTAASLRLRRVRHKRGLPCEQVMIHSKLKLCSSQLKFMAYSAVTEWQSDEKNCSSGLFILKQFSQGHT